MKFLQKIKCKLGIHIWEMVGETIVPIDFFAEHWECKHCHWHETRIEGWETYSYGPNEKDPRFWYRVS